MIDTNTLIIPGLRLGFFPMRPSTGTVIVTPPSIDRVMDTVGADWVIQPKLNGDRATLTVLDGEVYVFNRHGTSFKHTVLNRDRCAKLPNKTTLDGEVYDRKFTPFEVLVYSGKSYLAQDVSVRIEKAKEIAGQIDVWVFEPPTREQLYQMLVGALKSNGAVQKWEGLVRKRRKTPYTVMGTADGSSMDWFKHKWIK